MREVYIPRQPKIRRRVIPLVADVVDVALEVDARQAVFSQHLEEDIGIVQLLPVRFHAELY